MDTLKPKCCIVLHPSWASELPDSFSILVRSERFVDCTSYEMGTLYIEVEAIEQRLQMGTVKFLIPHRLVSVVLIDPKNIIGFAPLEPHTDTETH